MTEELGTRLRTRSLRARGLLDPFVLPRIDRPDVWTRYLAAIARARDEARPRLIPVLGGAGLGKSTLLGAVWDAENDRGLTWLVTCAEVSVPAEPAAIDLAFGRALTLDRPLTEACRTVAAGGPSLLLIDTLDLVLTRATVVPLRNFFYDLLAAGVTVLFTCRDFEYDRYFAAHRDHLPDLDRSVDGQFVPPFTMPEVEEATRRFAERTHGPAAAARFARSVVDLAADRRPIREIVQNPLLLAMLCDLFPGGDVPPDLTVAQLYQRFWSSHVAMARNPQTPDTAGPRKERICLEVASRILDASEEHFVETVAAGDLLEQTEDAIGQASILELLSEGVIRERSTRFSFFHQTFAEFVIARLLTESSQVRRRDDLLELLQASREAERLHLWPVVRQLLVLVDEDAFRGIAGRMAPVNLAAFRAVTTAAATRRDGWELLSGLADTAIVEGSEFQAAYLIAVEIAGAGRKQEAGPLLLKMIVEGDSRTAAAATKLAGDFAAGAPAFSLASILDAIDSRAGSGEENFIRHELQAAMIDGLTASAPARLGELRELLPRLTSPARERLLDIHAQESVALADAEALLAALRAEALPKELHRPAARLLDRTVRARRRTDWVALLTETWHPGWEYARGHAAASLLEESPERAAEVVRLMFTSTETIVGACHTAIASASGTDVAVHVASALLADWDLAARRVHLAAAIIQAIAGALPEETRRTLRERMASLASEEEEKPVIALAALASSAEDEQAVLSFVDGLPDKLAFRILPAVIRAFRAPLGPNALRAALVRVERTLPRGLAQNAQVTLVNLLPEPERSETLTRLSSDPRFPDRTRKATAALAVSIAPAASLGSLVPIVARPQQSIRLHVVQALAHAVENGGRLSASDLETVAGHLRDEPDSAVLQWFFELAMWWTRAEGTVPDGVLRVCQSAIVPRLATIRGGAQRQAVVFLKWAASVCSPGTDAFTRVRAMIVEVFLRLDFQRFGDGESEGLEMLSHVVRSEPSFGRTLVDLWERSVTKGQPVAPYTLRALVYLLNRTRDRDLYNRMLLNPACPQLVRAMILKHLDM